MKKSSLRRALVALCALGLMGLGGVAYAAGPGPDKSIQDPRDITSQGDISFKGQQAKNLKGRVFGHWADNPDGEILFGIQYWNTSAPAEAGNPPGRASDDRIQTLPDPLVSCCAWGYQNGKKQSVFRMVHSADYRAFGRERQNVDGSNHQSRPGFCGHGSATGRSYRDRL